MLYILAVFIPPLAVMLAGRIISGIIFGLLWAFVVALVFPLSHPIFVILSWIMISQAKGDRRHREMMRAVMHKKD